MIDDDEWPEPNWIAEFLEGAARHRRRCAAGLHPVHAADDSARAHPRHPPCHRSCRHAARRGQSSDLPQGAGANIGALVRSRLRPDRRRGSGFLPAPASAPASVSPGRTRPAAWGDVAGIRHDLGWVLKRAYSNGNSDMRVLLKHRPGIALIAREGAKILGALLLSLPLAFILAAEPESPARAACQTQPGGGQADGDDGLRATTNMPWSMANESFALSYAPPRDVSRSVIAEIAFIALAAGDVRGPDAFRAAGFAHRCEQRRARAGRLAAPDHLSRDLFPDPVRGGAPARAGRAARRAAGAVALLAWCFVSAFWSARAGRDVAARRPGRHRGAVDHR